MDAPAWDSGLQSAMRNTHSSFVTFFSTSETESRLPSKCTNLLKPDHGTMSWGMAFAPTRPITRPPAWHRVPSEANSSANATRVIMKRVNLPTRRDCQNHFFLDKRKEAAEAALVQAWTKIEKCEMPKQKIRRTSSYSQNDADNKVCGVPQSLAEMASAVLQAKVDLADGILAMPLTAVTDEVKRLRSRVPYSTIPMKRRIDRYIRLGESGMLGGYRLRTYGQILPILREAAEKRDKKIDNLSESIAQAFASLKDARRESRRRLTVQGIHEQSDIQDVTGLESTLTLARPNIGTADSAKSPTKKVASPVQPMKLSPGRLSSSAVKLVPASSPGVEPSPTKTLSAPPTPLQQTPSRMKLVQTPSPLGQTLHTASGTSQSPFKFKFLSISPGHTNIFKTPSVNDSFITLQRSPAKSSPVQESPSKINRPVAPTPSRWTRRDVVTPCRSMPPPSQPSSAAQGSSELGLVASIPPSTPQLQPRARPSPVAWDTSEISFGTISPSFSSASWLGHVDARPRRHIKKSNRRRSEPLIRSCFEAQTARRQSVSPRKLVFQGDYIFPQGGTSHVATPATSRTVRFSDTDGVENNSDQTPQQTVSSDVTLNMTTPAISWGRMNGRLSDEGVHATPTLNRAGTTGVHNVDMRQNPDIFGAPASSPRHTSPASMSYLAETEEEICDGQTNVHMAQENEKLIVSLKLPHECAHLLPNNQGPAQPHLTTADSAISASPRVSFDQTIIFEAGEQVGNAVASAASPIVDDEQTLVVSDFAASPTGTKVDSAFECELNSTHESVSAPVTLATSDVDEEQAKISSPALEPDSNALPKQANDATQPDSANVGPETEPDSPLSEIDHTPTRSGLDIMGAALSVIQNGGQTPSKTPEQKKEPLCVAEPTAPSQPATLRESIAPVPVSALNSTPTLNTSFTPVNQSVTPSRRTSGRGSVRSNSVVPEEESKTQVTEQDEQEPQQVDQYDDSPGRDYMRDFIKRSSRKRMSTTDAGSPIAAPAKRVPLGIKSPNTESPQKSKRKLEADKPNAESPLKKVTEPSPKKARRADKASPRKKTAKVKDKALTGNNASRATPDCKTALDVAANADEQEDAAEADSAPGARRSTRIRSQSEPTTAAKSSIPTAIKLGARPGAGRGGLASAARSEQQDLSHQTRMNTRKNKANAEYPAQILARYQEQAQREGSDEEVASSGSETSTNPSKSRKNVGWRTPLESHQELVEEPKKARVGFAKSKITYGSSGITKPSKNGSVQKQQRTAKVAATLGMSQNGTPAKARVTRSSTRVRS